MTKVIDNRTVLASLLNSSGIAFGSQSLDVSIKAMPLEAVNLTLKALTKHLVQDDLLKTLISKSNAGLSEEEFQHFQKMALTSAILATPIPAY